MSIRSILSVIVGSTLLAAPVAAQSDLSRASMPSDGESELVGNPWLPIAIALAAIIAGVLIALDDDDQAVSP